MATPVAGDRTESTISARQQPSGVTPNLRRTCLASYSGSAIEFYDFFIYGTAAALVFPTVFFPELNHLVATTASLGSFACAFLARPVGAAVFGHFGDRIGRKHTLVITLLLMGIATVGVGLLPGTATLGVAAPLLLVALRLIQGFAVGGEWAGAALLSTEQAPPDRRGFFGMFTQLGLGTALVMSNLVFLVVHQFFDEAGAAFLQWGWRIPFLLSAVLIAVALYIRLHIDEEPTEVTAPHEGTPMAELFRNQGRQVLLAGGAAICAPMLVFQAGTYFTHFAAEHLGYGVDLVLLVSMIGGLVAIGTAALTAIWSDRVGRIRAVTVAFALSAPWAFAVFPLIELRNHAVFCAAIVITYALIGACMGPMAAFLPEIFAERYRYTGAALSHTIGAIVGGALPPVLSPVLIVTFGGWSVAAMMGGLAVVSLICVTALPETAPVTPR
jgi:MFS family permease